MMIRKSLALLVLLSSVKARQMETSQTGMSTTSNHLNPLELFEAFIGGLATGSIQAFDLIYRVVLAGSALVHFIMVGAFFADPTRTCSRNNSISLKTKEETTTDIFFDELKGRASLDDNFSKTDYFLHF